jgi:hypothetical protein
MSRIAARRATYAARAAREYLPKSFPSIDADDVARELFDDARAVAAFGARDEATARKQLGHACAQAIGGERRRCGHGYSRALLYAPLSTTDATVGLKAEHALSRLSCPELCDAVDAFERAGGIHAVAAACDEDETLKQSLERAHRDAPKVRNWLLGEETSARVRDGDAQTDFIVNRTGLVGVSLDALEAQKTWKKVKCLHAHIADTLVRGRGKNAVGAFALDELERRGTNVDGTPECWRRCAPEVVQS